MKKRSIILVILVALILIVPTSLYFLVFEKPIKAMPNELILSEEELPTWAFVQSSSSSIDAINSFHNSSVEVGYNLSIVVWSFSSFGSAHDFFRQLASPSEPLSPVLGDEGGRYISTFSECRNETSHLIGIACTYAYREANIIAYINFFNDGTWENPLDPNGTYYKSWMDPIVELQMAKIHQYNIHIL